MERKESILQFRTFVSAMPHFRVSRDLHMRRLLAGDTKLARPSAHTDEKHVAVGTENVDGSEQTLLCLNTDSLRGNMQVDPSVAKAVLPKGIQGTLWVGPSTVLVCVGDPNGPSQMLIYNIDVDGSCTFALKDDSRKFNESIREMASHPSQQNIVLYGGYDRHISIFDVHHGPVISSFDVEGDVSSVRWDPHHGNGRLASCTTNEGQLKIFDVHGGHIPAYTYNCDIRSHLNLYSHCQTSEYQMLFSYEDNYIEAIDIRKNQKSPLGCFITGTMDTYCYMVGDLQYRQGSGLLLATGMADFSVYKNFRSGPDKNIAKLWCHSSASGNRTSNNSNVTTHGTFLSDNWVVATHGGGLSLYQIE